MRALTTILALVLLGASAAPGASRASRGHDPVSGLGILELEIGYTTLATQFYRPVSGRTILDGARNGIVAYLVGRGISSPQVPIPTARDERRAEDAVVIDVLLAAKRYGSKIDTNELIDAALEGELAAMHDPYTLLFHPEAYHKFVAFLDGSAFGGIGVELAVEPDGVRVSDVFPGGPADKAGIREGDVLTTIDERPIAGLGEDRLRSLLRGKTGSVVRLGVRRDGADLPQPLAVTRAKITPPDVIARMLPGGVGYLHLRTFGAQAGDQIAAALERLHARGARAYVVDLRGNGGGYRDAAIDVASHFIATGPIVSMQWHGGSRTTYPAHQLATIAGPLAVLVDHDTASASEIVAGAIQDDRAGIVVGERTFGKGLVQEVFPLPDGYAMKVTTARYFTPKGRDINGVGILPDVVVAEPKDARAGEPGSDPQLDRALAALSSA